MNTTGSTAILRTRNAIGLFVVGSITTAVCMPTVLLILLKENLRNQKEYIVIVGAILMESIYNAGFMVQSSMYLMRHIRMVPVVLNRWTCMITNPSNILFALGIPLTGFAVLLFSADRLIAVLYPTRYYQFSAAYAIKLNIAFAMPAIALLIIALLSSYLAKDEIFLGTDCNFAFAVTNVPWILIRWSRIATVALAIAIYIRITAVLWAQRNRFTSIMGHNRTSLMIRRTMATIGLTLISAFLLLLVPDLISLLNWLTDYSTVLHGIVILRGVFNLFVYTWRHKALRKALFWWRFLWVSTPHSKTHAISRSQFRGNAFFIGRK